MQNPKREYGDPVNDGSGGLRTQRRSWVQIDLIKQGDVDVLDGRIPLGVDFVDAAFPACDLMILDTRPANRIFVMPQCEVQRVQM